MVDLTKGFYLSSSYPLSQSVQHNVLTAAHDLSNDLQSMFIWNTYLLSEMSRCVGERWYCHLIQGVFLQQHCIQHGKQFQLTLIARRSR